MRTGHHYTAIYTGSRSAVFFTVFAFVFGHRKEPNIPIQPKSKNQYSIQV